MKTEETGRGFLGIKNTLLPKLDKNLIVFLFHPDSLWLARTVSQYSIHQTWHRYFSHCCANERLPTIKQQVRNIQNNQVWTILHGGR